MLPPLRTAPFFLLLQSGVRPNRPRSPPSERRSIRTCGDRWSFSSLSLSMPTDASFSVIQILESSHPKLFMWWIWWIQIPLGFLSTGFFSPPVSDRTSTWDCISSCQMSLIGVSVHVKLLLSSCTYILLSKIVWIHTLIVLYISIRECMHIYYEWCGLSMHLYYLNLGVCMHTPFSDYHIHIFYSQKVVWTHTLVVLYITVR